MTDNDKNINYSDIPQLSDKELSEFKKAQPITDFTIKKIPERPNKIQKTLRFDADMLNWYQENHKHYQSQMNAVLRAYYEAHKSAK